MVHEKLTVGAAREALEHSPAGLFKQAGVNGVGVGLREQKQAFIVTVKDLPEKRQFLNDWSDKHIAGLPVHVDVSSIWEASAVVPGHDFDTRLLKRQSVPQRVMAFAMGLLGR